MECEGKIGKGSYGTVTKVISTTSILTDREFALKTIDRVFFSPDREQVLAELAVLEACDHPNLIRLIDAYEIEGDSTKIYFVFEPWAPYTLESFLYTKDSQRWEGCGWFKPNDIASDQVIFRIMRNLADAVQHLHQHFIKHKDIKAQNTLLYNEGSVNIRVILTDMGKGKIHKKDATTNYIDSTIAFLAPEQIDEAESSLQADVWQLGCCFAQLLVLSCGGTDATHALWKSYSDTLEDRSCCVALELDNFMATLEKICGSQPIALGIVKGMLKKDPNTRSDIYQVLCALKSVVS
jgi:serine/threonine protein kinase